MSYLLRAFYHYLLIIFYSKDKEPTFAEAFVDQMTPLVFDTIPLFVVLVFHYQNFKGTS